MSSVDSGRRAEQVAAVYLEMRGFKVLERNWRRPRAEIDVVAIKDDVLHFIEVKYRHSDTQGSGFDAITASKLRHMQRAAWLYVDEAKWQGEYVLSAIELSGPDYSVLAFSENVY